MIKIVLLLFFIPRELFTGDETLTATFPPEMAPCDVLFFIYLPSF